MSFNLSEFLKKNILNGFSNGSFTEAQVNIFAFNYLSRGQLTQVDFDTIQNTLYPPEPDPEVV